MELINGFQGLGPEILKNTYVAENWCSLLVVFCYPTVNDLPIIE